MQGLVKAFNQGRLAPTLTLVAVVLLASWMGDANGGYFAGGWTPVALILAALLMLGAVSGALRGAASGPGGLALGLFAAYTAWTFASILWSPNQGAAWVGAGQTLLYLLAFWISTSMLAQGAYRRWVLAASVAGPAVLAALTLYTLPDRLDDLYQNARLLGTVGYYNGVAAFALVPFWAAIYLAGSRRVNPLIRAVSLAGAVFALELTILAQSRGAAVALLLSVPVYFLLSGQRLRGLLALAPVAVALVVLFPELNAVYQAGSGAGEEGTALAEAALREAQPYIWLGAGLAGVYGLLWGFVDQQWRPPQLLSRVAGGAALVAVVFLAVYGSFTFVERYGDPVEFAGEKWVAFKTNDTTGQDQSRYLSISGSGRYALWQTTAEAFFENPVAGVGTHNWEAFYYNERDRVAGHVRQPHILPLEILAEKGIIGGLLFAGFIGVCVFAGLRQRFGQLNSEAKAQIGATLAAVSYWFVHSGAEWFWQLPAITLPVFVYLAMLVTPWRRRETQPLRWPVRAAALVVGLVAIAAIAPLFISNVYLQRSYDAGDTAEALEYTERAQTFNPLDPEIYIREAELAIEAGQWDRVVDSYRTAIRRNPRHYETYMFLGDFYQRRAELEKALELYREALARNPLEPELQLKTDRLEKQLSA